MGSVVAVVLVLAGVVITILLCYLCDVEEVTN